MSSDSGDENGWESSSYDSDEHDSDDFVYYSSSDSSSSDYLEEVDIPDDYNTVGIESDDDEDECWSLVNKSGQEFFHSSTEDCLQFGKPAKVYLDGYRPCDLVNDVIDNEFLDIVILCTNAHGRNDVKFKNSRVKVYGDELIPFSEKGLSVLRGFLALKIYLGLMRVKDVHEAWSQKDPLKAYPFVQWT